jgi:DNA-binding IclR family transcriptional regulator
MRNIGLTVHLAILEEGEAILIDRIEPPGAPRLATWVGKRMGLHCTALGKALIAKLPENELTDMIRRQGMIRHNENTIGSMKKLRVACDSVMQLGYATDDEEEEIGVRCIGAPVLNSMGQVVAAISISGTKNQIPDISIKALLVKEAARALSGQLTPVHS